MKKAKREVRKERNGSDLMKELVGKEILVFVKERSRPISGTLSSFGAKYLILKSGDSKYFIYHRNILYIRQDGD